LHNDLHQLQGFQTQKDDKPEPHSKGRVVQHVPPHVDQDVPHEHQSQRIISPKRNPTKWFPSRLSSPQHHQQEGQLYIKGKRNLLKANHDIEDVKYWALRKEVDNPEIRFVALQQDKESLQ
jgi:hypothetical protein